MGPLRKEGTNQPGIKPRMPKTSNTTFRCTGHCLRLSITHFPFTHLLTSPPPTSDSLARNPTSVYTPNPFQNGIEKRSKNPTPSPRPPPPAGRLYNPHPASSVSTAVN